MPSLSRDLVEHRLPIKAGFRPYKQPARHFNPAMYDRIKEEINRLLDAGLFGLIVMRSISLILCPLRRKIRVRL